MKFTDTAEWRKVVDEKDPRRKIKAVKSVARTLQVDAVDELLDLCETGSDIEKDTSVRLLMSFCKREDIELTAERMSRWVNLLAETVEKDYPTSRLSILSLQALTENAPDQAQEFLFDTLQLGNLNDEQLQTVAMTLSVHVGTWPKAVDRLREIEAMGGGAGERAKVSLESSGFISEERIEALARDWREQRTPKALGALYNRYIANLRGGEARIEDLVRLLGQPSNRKGNAYWYHASEGTSLYFDGDEEGYLRSIHFT